MGSRSAWRLARSAALCVIVAAATACGDATTPGPTDDSTPSDSAQSESAQSDSAQSGPGAAPAVASPDAERLVASYDRGLDFLLAQQTDGRWSVQDQPHVGFTALCVANLLERPGGAREADRAVIDQGIAFIAGSLAEDGSVDQSYRPNYETSVAIMALAATGDAAHAPLIERSAAFIKTLQRLEEENPTWGGIGYGSDDTRSDLSNTQYALASLRAAGIPEDDPVFQRAVQFLQRTQNRRENEAAGEPTSWVDKETGKKLARGNDGGANYFPGNSKAGHDEGPDGVGVLRSYGSMTYALLRCYAFAGLEKDDPRVAAAIDWLAEHWTLDRNPGMSGEDEFSGLFYMYATMAKAFQAAELDALEVPDKGTVDWRRELSVRLVSLQRDDGSWLNERGSRWQEGDPVLATSYALTALAPCQR